MHFSWVQTDKRVLLKFIFLYDITGKIFILLATVEVQFFLTTEASQVYLPSPLCEERKAAGSKQSQRPDSVETEQGELARQINKEFAGVCKTKAAAKEVSVGKKKKKTNGTRLHIKRNSLAIINWKSISQKAKSSQGTAQDGEDGGVG